MDTGLRSELVGKGFTLIEFLLARIAETAPTAEPGQLAELEEMSTVLDRYQVAEAGMLQRTGPVRDFLPVAAECGAQCRGYAQRWADHPDFDRDWLPRT